MKHQYEKTQQSVEALIFPDGACEPVGKYTAEQSVDQDASVQTLAAPILSKLANFIMKKGNKAKAFTIVQKVLCLLQEQLPKNKASRAHTVKALQKALDTVKPAFELRKARFAGKTQFIPACIVVQKQENKALRWIVDAARHKQKKGQAAKNKTMYTFAFFLAQEFLDAFKGQGVAKQKKDEVHKLAETNRGLASRRWW
jgi:small subunit ribosomal protein S7